MFRFIHAADIHLDSPLLNLQRYDGAPTQGLRVATREAFDNLVQLAIDEQVRFIVIAGDLYDKDSPNFHTPIHVRNKMRDLSEHGIDVFVIQGNHDATAESKRAFALSMPENVHVFSTQRAETKLLEDVQVAIHGQGFAKRSIETDLSADYPAALPGYFNIGLLHTNLGGNANHDNYAPSSREGLTSKQYHYWALGHIHRRNTSIGPNPHIIYPGNTQGRHIREAGPKGCVLVTVGSDRRASVSFRATDVWRWQLCEVDVTDCATPTEIMDSIRMTVDRAIQEAEERSLAVRVRLTGSTMAHQAWVQQASHWREALQVLMLDHFDDRVWIEKIEAKTKPLTQGAEPLPDAAWGELIASMYDMTPDPDVISEIRDDLAKVVASIPRDPRLAMDIVDLEDDAQVADLISDAKQFIAAQLLGSEEEA